MWSACAPLSSEPVIDNGHMLLIGRRDLRSSALVPNRCPHEQKALRALSPDDAAQFGLARERWLLSLRAGFSPIEITAPIMPDLLGRTDGSIRYPGRRPACHQSTQV
jgi:hypothetical protein